MADLGPEVQVGDIGGAPVIPITLILIGGYLAWFGVKYWRSDVAWPSDPIKAVLQGKQLPAAHAATTSAGFLGEGIPGTWTTEVPGGASATGQAIANDALQYQGAGYEWAGAPANGIGHWDCSSFVNWVVGHDMQMAIPPYGGPQPYTGNVHGPATLSWIGWSGCRTVGHTGADSVAGDICVWQTHMGIAVGGGKMISAENPTQGTQVAPIDGFIHGEQLFIRRLNAEMKPGSPGTGGGGRKK